MSNRGSRHSTVRGAGFTPTLSTFDLLLKFSCKNTELKGSNYRLNLMDLNEQRGL